MRTARRPSICSDREARAGFGLVRQPGDVPGRGERGEGLGGLQPDHVGVRGQRCEKQRGHAPASARNRIRAMLIQRAAIPPGHAGVEDHLRRRNRTLVMHWLGVGGRCLTDRARPHCGARRRPMQCPAPRKRPDLRRHASGCAVLGRASAMPHRDACRRRATATFRPWGAALRWLAPAVLACGGLAITADIVGSGGPLVVAAQGRVATVTPASPASSRMPARRAGALGAPRAVPGPPIELRPAGADAACG